MSWNITDQFPNWGESGESPPDGFFYEGGDQVNEKHLDYLWDSVKGLEDEVRAALTDIDNNNDGIVDQADAVTNFDEKAQDAVGAIINGGNNVTVTYDDTNNAINIDASNLSTENIEDTVASLVASDNNLSWSYDDTNNTLSVSLSDSITVNTLDADSATITNTASAGTLDADSATITNTASAGTLEASDSLGNATYPTLSDVPTTLPAGTQVYVQDEQAIYVEDGL